MKTIAISSIKGGVGKTSTLILMAQMLANQEKKLLLIDLDLQNSLSFKYLDDFDQVEDKNICKALQEQNLKDNILSTNVRGIDIIPSHFNLVNIRTINPKILGRLMTEIKHDYDYCFIDTAPTLDNHVFSAWNAADMIITPVGPGLFDFKSAMFLRDQIEIEYPEKIEIWKLLLTGFQRGKATISADYKELFRGEFPNLMKQAIPSTTLVKRIVDMGEPLTSAKRKQHLFNSISSILNQIDICCNSQKETINV